jgi:hypothetical protein
MYRTDTGTQTLRAEQAQALVDAIVCGGAYIEIKPGGGKTLIALLLPIVLRSKSPLFVMPAGVLRNKPDEISKMRHHWKVADVPMISYSALSSINGMSRLESQVPDLIIFDESHAIKDEKTSRSRKIRRFLKAHPSTVVVCMTGSPITHGQRDNARHLHWCLRSGTPYPINWTDQQEWARALDVKRGFGEMPLEPGQLSQFSAGSTDLEIIRRDYGAFRHNTPGVIASTKTNTPPCVLDHKILELSPPDTVKKIVDEFLKTGTLPSGEYFPNALDRVRHRDEILCGFFYDWIWPNNEKNLNWIEARQLWRKFVGDVISNRPSLQLDSPLAVWHAVERGKLDDGGFDLLENWRKIKPQYTPVTRTTWISPWLVDFIVEWMNQNETAIVWTEHRAMIDALKKRKMNAFHAADPEFFTNRDTCAASIQSYGTGIDGLQHKFNKLLYLSPPTTATQLEQSLARVYRIGQTKKVDVMILICHNAHRKQWDLTKKLVASSEQFGDVNPITKSMSWSKER